MLQSISVTPAAVLSLTFELSNKIEGDQMCTSKPSLADERLLGQHDDIYDGCIKFPLPSPHFLILLV
jgi:hypothetical protein